MATLGCEVRVRIRVRLGRAACLMAPTCDQVQWVAQRGMNTLDLDAVRHWLLFKGVLHISPPISGAVSI